MLLLHTRLLRKAGVAAALSVIGFLAVSSPAEAQVNCGDTIAAHTVLQHDLECLADGTALTVQGPATLDLSGHTVRCSGEGSFDNECVLLSGRGARLLAGTVVAIVYPTVIRLAGQGGHWVGDVWARTIVDAGFRIVSDGNRLLTNRGSGERGFVISGERNLLRANLGDGDFAADFDIFGRGNVLIGNKATYSGMRVWTADNRLHRNVITAPDLDAFLFKGIDILPQAHSTLLSGNVVDGHVTGINVQSDRNKIIANIVENAAVPR